MWLAVNAELTYVPGVLKEAEPAQEEYTPVLQKQPNLSKYEKNYSLSAANYSL